MKKLILSLTALFLSFSAFSLSFEDFSLSIEPIVGFKQGQLNELVYEKDSNGDLQKLSELNWPIKSIPVIGGSINFSYKKIKSFFTFTTLIPKDSGIMEDSDWMTYTDMKTTYSKSENSLTEGFNFSVLLKYDFNPIEKLIISPSIEYEFKTISFEARNAYGWYGNNVTPMVSWDDPLAIFYASGTLGGIDYRRDVSQFLMGFSLDYYPIKVLCLSTSFSITPYAYTLSYDTHYSASSFSSGTDYADEIEFIFNRFKFSTGCTYFFNNQWSLSLTIAGFYASETKGINYSKSHSVKSYTNNTEVQGAKSGASAWELDTKISVRYTIF